MTIRAYRKVLSAVEVTRKASNQHEFNAGALRRKLGFRAGPIRGLLDVLCYPSNDAVPTVARATYTLYDAREATPGRSEWRMYYTTDALEQCARENDIMLVLRPSTASSHLIAIVARPGTAMADVVGVFD